MSRAKKTKRAKQYSLDNRYRHITETLNRIKKGVRMTKKDGVTTGV